MMRVEAHHMSFPVANLARSKEFYEDILGLRPTERPDFPFKGEWYDAGGVQVHLIEIPEGLDMAAPPRAINPLDRHGAFAIDDYPAAVEFLKSKNIEVVETSVEMGQIFVQDPDGHIIELIVDETLEARLGEAPGEA